jgi:CheY-specific phosphatase CheX
MQLYRIHTKILTPFVNETINTLDAMTGLRAKAGQGFQEAPEDFYFRGFAVCVVAKTHGAIEGKIIMHHNTETALEIGNRVRANLLGLEEFASEIDEEVSEALTEFSNTAIGLATRGMSEANLRITFDPPLFISLEEDSEFLTEGVEEILTIPIDVENVGQFYFSYLLHKRTE